MHCQPAVVSRAFRFTRNNEFIAATRQSVSPGQEIAGRLDDAAVHGCGFRGSTRIFKKLEVSDLRKRDVLGVSFQFRAYFSKATPQVRNPIIKRQP